MKFSLVFNQSSDSIDFEVIYNHEIFEHFVEVINQTSSNSFTDDGRIYRTVNGFLNDLHNNLTLSNSVLSKIGQQCFDERDNRLDYLDQDFLNRQHEKWVFSQNTMIDVDELKFSSDPTVSRVGWKLHDMLPDDIRKIRMAHFMQLLGFIFPYEEVNMTVHRLECFFAKPIEYKSDRKWDVFDNPFVSSMISRNDVVNFSFAYTYVGRQYYNKWQFFDTDLNCKDHYNYETLEKAFQINFDRPQTIDFSTEYRQWSEARNLPMVTTQIPIANAVDLERNIKHYRTIIYENSRAGNQASIIIR